MGKTWRKRAISSLAATRFLSSSSFWSLFSKVEGSMLGNTRSSTGIANSMKGMISIITTGTSLKISAVVLSSCFLSRLSPTPPSSIFIPAHKCTAVVMTLRVLYSKLDGWRHHHRRPSHHHGPALLSAQTRRCWQRPPSASPPDASFRNF